MGVILRRYIDILTININFPYNYTPLVLALFLAASLLLCHFKNVFSVLFLVR